MQEIRHINYGLSNILLTQGRMEVPDHHIINKPGLNYNIFSSSQRLNGPHMHLRNSRKKQTGFLASTIFVIVSSIL